MRPYKREKFTTMVMVTAFGLGALGFSNTALAASIGKMHEVGTAKTTFVAGRSIAAPTKTRKKHTVKKVKAVKKHLNKTSSSTQATSGNGVTSITQ